MNNPHEWTEEQVAAALADLLDQPQPTTDNLALQPYLETFQQLHALSEAPQEFFQKDLAWLIIGQQLQQPKKVNLRPWLARLRSALTVSWRPLPRLALGLTVFIALIVWLFWPINPAKVGERPLPTEIEQQVNESRVYALAAPTTNRFRLLLDGDLNLGYFIPSAASQEETLTALTEVVEPAQTEGNGSAAATQSQTRMVQQEADLNLVVVDVPATVEQITDLAFAQGGYLTNLESGHTTSGNPRATVQLRVPAEQFFATLSEIKALALEVKTENITSQDVTAQYVDLNARLRNLQLTETEIGDLLATAQDRGESSQEILRIYDDLTDVREQIEQLHGQIQYLEQTVAMSLISVDLVTKPEEIEEVEEELKPDPFSAGETANEAWVNLVNIVQDIVVIVIRIAIHSPLVLLPAGLIWLVWRRRR